MKRYSLNSNKGQSLIEVLIAVTVGALIVGSAVAALIFTVRSNQQNRATDTASSLAQELLDNIRPVAEGKWQKLYCLDSITCLPAKGSSAQYYLVSYKTLSGTVAVTNDSPDVIGTETAFGTATEIVVGDYIKIGAETFKVYGTPNNLSLTLSSNYQGSNASGLPAYREFSFRNGTETMPVGGVTYTRSFSIENVNRDSCGTKNITSADQVPCSPSQVGVLDDPSTQKITAKVIWPQGGSTAEVLVSEYLTRAKNEINQFTDWSGVSGVAGPVTKPTKDYFDQSDLDTTTPWTLRLLTPATSGWLESSTFDTGYVDGVAFNSLMWKGVGNAVKFQFASSNSESAVSEGSPIGPIDSTNKYAWNDIIGWLNFYDAPGGPAAVTTAKMTRWATTLSDGEFALDCATTPSGGVCAASNFYVSNNNGNLAGWAWNDAYGWVSFCGGQSTADCPGTVAYQVTIDQTTAEFHGWAWNDIIGWISFNCAEPGVCLTSDYKVKVAGGGSGWNYIGPDGSYSSSYTTTGSGAPVQIVTAHHNNKRYYRYKVYLTGDATLIVDDIIVNWSP